MEDADGFPRFHLHRDGNAEERAGEASFDQNYGLTLRLAGSLNQIAIVNLAELRRELARLGLDWQDHNPAVGFAPRVP